MSVLSKTVKANPVPIAIGAAVVVAGIYLYLTNSNRTGKTSIVDCLWRTGGTFSKDAINSAADSFYNAIWHDQLWEDDSAAADVLLSMENESDVQNLICAYGERRYDGPGGFLWDKMTLSDTVAAYLDFEYIQDINQLYKSKGLTFRFYGS